MTTYIQAGCTIGPDTVIHPFSYIGCESAIGRDCEIGPFAFVPAKSVVSEGSTVSENVRTT